MSNGKRKILILVEGARTDTRLMKHLLAIYNIDAKYEIVSYKTNIYAFYNTMFAENDPDVFDILQVLKERENDEERKLIFDDKYSDILLIFDFDPHDSQYSKEKVIRMAEYFTESSDMGKLYINYPMVEAFYHMRSIPDATYNNCIVTLSELKNGTYKERVNIENRNRDYSKFAVTREECNLIIKQNIEKSNYILGQVDDQTILPALLVLEKQIDYLERFEKFFVLCTCVFFITDYNPRLIVE